MKQQYPPQQGQQKPSKNPFNSKARRGGTHQKEEEEEEEESRCFNSPSGHQGRGGGGAEATINSAAASKESCDTLAQSRVSLRLPQTQSDSYRREGRQSWAVK
jgi:hypothetical protein